MANTFQLTQTQTQTIVRRIVFHEQQPVERSPKKGEPINRNAKKRRIKRKNTKNCVIKKRNSPTEVKIKQNSKRKILPCDKYEKGKCLNGVLCSYMHQEFPCPLFYLRLECPDEHCKFLHNEPLPVNIQEAFIKYVKTLRLSDYGPNYPELTGADVKAIINRTQIELLQKKYAGIKYEKLASAQDSRPLDESLSFLSQQQLKQLKEMGVKNHYEVIMLNTWQLNALGIRDGVLYQKIIDACLDVQPYNNMQKDVEDQNIEIPHCSSSDVQNMQLGINHNTQQQSLIREVESIENYPNGEVLNAISEPIEISLDDPITLARQPKEVFCRKILERNYYVGNHPLPKVVRIREMEKFRTQLKTLQTELLNMMPVKYSSPKMSQNTMVVVHNLPDSKSTEKLQNNLQTSTQKTLVQNIVGDPLKSNSSLKKINLTTPAAEFTPTSYKTPFKKYKKQKNIRDKPTRNLLQDFEKEFPEEEENISKENTPVKSVKIEESEYNDEKVNFQIANPERVDIEEKFHFALRKCRIMLKRVKEFNAVPVTKNQTPTQPCLNEIQLEKAELFKEKRESKNKHFKEVEAVAVTKNPTPKKRMQLKSSTRYSKRTKNKRPGDDLIIGSKNLSITIEPLNKTFPIKPCFKKVQTEKVDEFKDNFIGKIKCNKEMEVARVSKNLTPKKRKKLISPARYSKRIKKDKPGNQVAGSNNLKTTESFDTTVPIQPCLGSYKHPNTKEFFGTISTSQLCLNEVQSNTEKSDLFEENLAGKIKQQKTINENRKENQAFYSFVEKEKEVAKIKHKIEVKSLALLPVEDSKKVVVCSISKNKKGIDETKKKIQVKCKRFAFFEEKHKGELMKKHSQLENKTLLSDKKEKTFVEEQKQTFLLLKKDSVSTEKCDLKVVEGNITAKGNAVVRENSKNELSYDKDLQRIDKETVKDKIEHKDSLNLINILKVKIPLKSLSPALNSKLVKNKSNVKTKKSRNEISKSKDQKLKYKKTSSAAIKIKDVNQPTNKSKLQENLFGKTSVTIECPTVIDKILTLSSKPANSNNTDVPKEKLKAVSKIFENEQSNSSSNLKSSNLDKLYKQRKNEDNSLKLTKAQAIDKNQDHVIKKSHNKETETFKNNQKSNIKLNLYKIPKLEVKTSDKHDEKLLENLNKIPKLVTSTCVKEMNFSPEKLKSKDITQTLFDPFLKNPFKTGNGNLMRKSLNGEFSQADDRYIQKVNPLPKTTLCSEIYKNSDKELSFQNISSVYSCDDVELFSFDMTKSRSLDHRYSSGFSSASNIELSQDDFQDWDKEFKAMNAKFKTNRKPSPIKKPDKCRISNIEKTSTPKQFSTLTQNISGKKNIDNYFEHFIPSYSRKDGCTNYLPWKLTKINLSAFEVNKPSHLEELIINKTYKDPRLSQYRHLALLAVKKSFHRMQNEKNRILLLKAIQDLNWCNGLSSMIKARVVKLILFNLMRSLTTYHTKCEESNSESEFSLNSQNDAREIQWSLDILNLRVNERGEVMLKNMISTGQNIENLFEKGSISIGCNIENSLAKDLIPISRNIDNPLQRDSIPISHTNKNPFKEDSNVTSRNINNPFTKDPIPISRNIENHFRNGSRSYGTHKLQSFNQRPLFYFNEEQSKP